MRRKVALHMLGIKTLDKENMLGRVGKQVGNKMRAFQEKRHIVVYLYIAPLRNTLVIP